MHKSIESGAAEHCRSMERKRRETDMPLIRLMLLWWMCGLGLVIMSGSDDIQVDAAGGSGGGYHFHKLAVEREYANQQGFEAKLVVTPASGNATLGEDISPLNLIVRMEKSTRLRVYISDVASARWEVPQSMLPRPAIDSKLDTPTESPLLALTYTMEPFGFAVTRISTGDVLFNSTPPLGVNSESLFSPLIFKNQYIELSTQLPKSATLFGLGESTRPDGLKLKKGKTYTLWTTDIAALIPDVDLYSAWPFYVDVRKGGVSHGVLLLNSNGMEVSYTAEALTYRVIGGVLDFYFFPGPTPLDVMDQYTQLVGRPAAQPYWAFGFHQCRWGYRNVSILKTVVENFKKAKIPMDTIWNDIDYSDRYLDFTHDEERFPLKEWRAFVDELHANGQHYVILVDPGIGTAYDDYKTYFRGLEQGIYLKNDNDEPYIGQVWPGPVVYPDFLNPKATAWWTTEVQLFHDQVPFDGMWIDMNELSNFCSGTHCTWNGTILGGVTDCYLQCTDTCTKFDEPPFKLNHYGRYERLNFLAAAMTARHYDGTLEYNAHSLYGLAESIATKAALTTVRKQRPFLLSRSTFVGSGTYTAHWTGDNKATFDDIAYSIVTVMNSGMAGIPMVGADICGFYGMASDDLCSRWIQMGAFHPFSRAHSVRDNAPKELYLREKVTVSARKALGLKYQLLPYYYTLNWEAHTKGYPMVRPLFMAFPTDPKVLDVSYQFLVGNHVLVSPVVTANATSVEAYFPEGTWYNLFDNSQMIVSKGERFSLQAPWNVINVHVHEGAIFPMQQTALTSAAVRKTPFTLVAAVASNSMSSTASGYLFLDDGEEIEMILHANQSTLVRFEAVVASKNGSFTSRVEHGEFAVKEGWLVDRVVVLGVGSAPSSVRVNREPKALVKVLHEDQRLEFSGLGLLIGYDFEIVWNYE